MCSFSLRRTSWANIAAFIPEPHILFTVVQPAASGNPAPSEAWRAGAWPRPAGRTQPMITCCTSSGRIFARSTAARIAAAPSSGAAKLLRSPWNAPIGVRAAETMTTGSGFMFKSFQTLKCFDGFGLQARDQVGSGQRPRKGYRLPRPQRIEVGIARLRRGGAQSSGQPVLRREGDLWQVLRLRFAQKAIRDAARGLAGEFFGDPGVVLARAENRLLVHLRRAALGAGNERRPELRRLGAEGEHRGNSGAVHDAASGDHGYFHRAHDQPGERERTGKGFLRIAQVGAPVTPGFAALRDDEVEAERLEALRFRNAGRASSDEDAELFESFNFLCREGVKMHRKNPRLDLFHRDQLRLEVGHVRRLGGLRRRHAHLRIPGRKGGERGALVHGVDRAGLRRDEKGDAERPVGLRARRRCLLFHFLGWGVSKTERTQRAGGGARPDELG